ncbi:MAG: DUF1338 domain-containing protein [Actinomycetota bacterium]
MAGSPDRPTGSKFPPRDAERLLELLWARYESEVPYARQFVELAGAFRNDHVAFRSLKRPGGGVELLGHVFERLGWRRAGGYEFPDTHLDAIYLAHPHGLPRVFLSQLLVERLPGEARRILEEIPREPPPPTEVEELADWFSGPQAPVREADLLALDSVSQYGAWVLAFGRKVNHFTASVDDIEAWDLRLREAGVPMKPGIEGPQEGPLRQTATLAAPLPVRVEGGGERHRPYAYLELAQRRPGFDGFLGAQARRLFDMTKR